MLSIHITIGTVCSNIHKTCYTALSHQGKTLAGVRQGARWVAFGVKKRKGEWMNEWMNEMNEIIFVSS